MKQLFPKFYTNLKFLQMKLNSKMLAAEKMLLHHVKHNVNPHDVMLQNVAAQPVRVPKRKVFKT